MRTLYVIIVLYVCSSADKLSNILFVYDWNDQNDEHSLWHTYMRTNFLVFPQLYYDGVKVVAVLWVV